ncbi:MAG: DUF177 domain-containing protein [Parvularcula sp.]|nr:DUF177 domain-containing protein [Parvularcula sp.]
MADRNAKSLSHPVPLDRLDDEPRRASLEASAEDRALLKERYDVESVEFLRGDLAVTRSGDIVRVTGTLKAELGRICGVSLEPMTEHIDETFDVEYRVGAAEDPVGELEADLDAPEPLTSDRIDLGDVLIEQLVLAMSPHPRKDDAQVPEDPGAGRESSPFDVLKDLTS